MLDGWTIYKLSLKLAIFCEICFFFKKARLNFNIVYAIASITTLAMSSAATAAHNDNDVTPPPFHLSVCWHISTASDSAFQCELLWKNHRPVRFGVTFLFNMNNDVSCIKRCQSQTGTLGIKSSTSCFSCIGRFFLLGAFAKFPRATISLSCLHVGPYVRPRGTTRLPLAGFSWNLIFEYFSKICRGMLILIKMGQE